MNQKAMQIIKPTIEEVQDKSGIWRKARKKVMPSKKNKNSKNFKLSLICSCLVKGHICFDKSGNSVYIFMSI